MAIDQDMPEGQQTTSMRASYPYVVVGGGNASGYAVKTLIENGVAGSDILLLCGEKSLPYERPALTKAYMHAPSMKVRARLPGFHTCVGGGGERQTKEWYAEKGLSVLISQNVTEISEGERKVKCADGSSYGFEKLFVATGCNSLNPAPDMYCGSNVFPIRSEADAASLVGALESKSNQSLVIIGGGYIGLEVAAAAIGWKDNLKDITVLNMDDRVMKRVFPDVPEFSEYLEANMRWLEKGDIVDGTTYSSDPTKTGANLGVPCTIMNGVGFDRLEKKGDFVSGVVLKSGTVVPCDVVVLGMGSRPATAWCKDAVKLDRGFVKVNDKFEFGSGMYAFGDCAIFPLAGQPTVLEHVAHCRASAKHAVLSALGKSTEPYSILPFFYSRMFEFTDNPLIWNMWGTRTATSKPHVYKKAHGYACVWVEPGQGGLVVAACLMLRDPAPTQEQLDGMKAMIGQTLPGEQEVVDFFSKL